MGITMDELITKTTEDFVSGMTKSGNFARNQIIALIREMDTIDGNLTTTDRNSQLIEGVAIGIQQVALSGTFTARVNKVINSIPTLRKETERSFIVRNGIISQNTVAFLATLEEDITSVMRNSIGENTVITEVMTPLITLLGEMVINQLPIDDAINLATDKVPSLFTQFAFVRVNTPLQAYVRDMNKVMADAAQLRWFRYSGPVGPTALGNPIRDFCRHRVGGTYLDSEIALWPQEDAPWQGMIPGTNSFNIFIVLGGFNCRHDLVAVKTKDVPQKDINRARRNGLI